VKGQISFAFDVIREEFRGSVPVPNRPEPVANDEADKTRHDTCRDRFRTGSGTEKPAADSSTVSRYCPGTLSKEREEAPEPVIRTGSLSLGGGVDPDGSPPPQTLQGVRGPEPLPSVARPVSEAQNRDRTAERQGSESGTGGVHVSGARGSAPTLRPYQDQSLVAIDREHETKRSTLLVLPTGCGKTVVFAELVRRRLFALVKRRFLIVAHRGELLKQAAKKLLDLGIYSALDQADHKASLQADVVVASIQTLRGARLERYPVDHFTDIIVDEAHHAAAKTYRDVLARFPNAKVLGVTATPDRGDKKALGKVFESVAFVYQMRKAIAEGYLSPLIAKRILVQDLDLSGVSSHHGDFDQNELSAAANEEDALLGVVKPLLEQAGARKTLVFGVDVAHAKALAETINSFLPGKAIALDGTANEIERAAVLDMYRRGVFQFLVNCALFTEGFDEPDVACVALARPTQSRALYTQMLGRGTRLVGATLAESIANGKPNCLVLDFVGNSAKHRLIGPADVLAGREIDDEERKAVEKKQEEDPQAELDSILDHAENEIAAAKERRRQKMNSAALVLYREREIDLFLGDQIIAFDQNCEAAQRPATAAQLAELLALKFGVPPVGFCEAEAAAMLQAVKARRIAGLCSIPQVRLFARLNLDTKTISFKRARELHEKLDEAVEKYGKNQVWKIPALAFGSEPEFRNGRRRA
jgi:superfamily II DNA or RNA helicase